MSTQGIAHRHGTTFVIHDDTTARRAARFAPRDLAYRAALGIGADEPIPRSLGSISSGAGPSTPLVSGGRMRGRNVIAL